MRVERIQAADTLTVSELLSEAFAAAIGATQYRAFLFRNVKAYLEAKLGEPPRNSVVLVGVDADCPKQTPPGWTLFGVVLPPLSALGSSSLPAEPPPERPQVLGTVELSLRPKNARSRRAQRTTGRRKRTSPAVPPPPPAKTPAPTPSRRQSAASVAELLAFGASAPLPSHASYVCNMAVPPQHRRRGVGRALLQAAEGFARLGAAGGRGLSGDGPPCQPAEVYLHCRLCDAPALALYLSEGAGDGPRSAAWVCLGLPGFLYEWVGRWTTDLLPIAQATASWRPTARSLCY